jgi:hypothetical protein
MHKRVLGGLCANRPEAIPVRRRPFNESNTWLRESRFLGSAGALDASDVTNARWIPSKIAGFPSAASETEKKGGARKPRP